MEIHWGSSFVTQAPPHVENHGKEPGYEAIGDHLWLLELLIQCPMYSHTGIC